MCAVKRFFSPFTLALTSSLSLRGNQKGWLLLAVIVILMLISLGVIMLMSQAQLSLKSVAQEHQVIQEKINQWPPLLEHKAKINGK